MSKLFDRTLRREYQPLPLNFIGSSNSDYANSNVNLANTTQRHFPRANQTTNSNRHGYQYRSSVGNNRAFQDELGLSFGGEENKLDEAEYNESDEEMVQTYGIANEQVGESSNSEHQSESSALLGGGRDAAVKKASTQLGDGHATMTSSVSNLINTIIGSGKCSVLITSLGNCIL